jgi:hypothetical protein
VEGWGGLRRREADTHRRLEVLHGGRVQEAHGCGAGAQASSTHTG